MKIVKFALMGFTVIVALIVLLVVAEFFPQTAQTRHVNQGTSPDNPLHIPPLLEPTVHNGEKVFDLIAQQGEMEFFPGKRTETLGFNGDYLGPTIRVRTGDKVRMNVTNDLNQTTTVHWHGMHLPAAMDGGPHQTIEPGGTWQPYWTITNEAASLWYHPHQMGVTGEHVYRGLAGLFIIDDDNSDSLAIPREYGVDDIPLIVQDRLFDTNGTFVYHSGAQAFGAPPPAGMVGDTILVNGTRAPYVEVPRKRVRLRVLNGSNGRRYNFGFSDGRPFYQIATDGGLLEAPVERTRMLLGVGERAEILVDLSDLESPVTLMSYPIARTFNGIGRNIFGEGDENQQFTIIELRPHAGASASQPDQVPAKLNTIQRLSESDATNTRLFRLDLQTINQMAMDDTRIDAVVKTGDVEIWVVRNESPFYHPFHIHGVQFQVLDRQHFGRPAPAPDYEQGWKDTVTVLPAETVRLIMHFNDYSDPHTPYMFHCHILEHEDMGMMGQFVVVDDPNGDIRIKSPITGSPEGHRSH
jgi:FtsP/CotA-like multicopper oxidase with cupredoxin domain